MGMPGVGMKEAIRVLMPEVASKIAAGEVVERPASVVKELVENSLDANATQITIEVRGGGVNLIRVVDNGAGILSGQVELAFRRYATSKINTLADLGNIVSLGFRGEALPSIAAVAEVDILTRTADEEAGTYLEMRDGLGRGEGQRGRPPGTTIAVRNLLRNFPARLKFLKSSATENGHIATVVSQYSLAFPEVRFTLLLEGRAALRTPGSGNLRDVLLELYGLEVAQAMLEMGARDEEPPAEAMAPLPQVSGMVSPPSVARSGRGYLSFFVNRRWVNSRMLARAVEEAYHALLMAGKHPIAVINISLPPQDVDVNVHPTKTEVRFRQEGVIFSTLQRAVRGALVAGTPVPRIAAAQPPPPSPRVPGPTLWAPGSIEAGQPAPPLVAPLPQASLPILRVLGQLSGSYILAEGPEGLYLIDQHAAHERVLCDRVRAQRQRQEVEVQGLLELVTIEVTARQEELLKGHGEALSGYGFALEPFGDRTYLVRTVPAILRGRDVTQAIREVLDSLAEGDAASDWEERLVVSLACHGAVRAGDTLSPEEMRELVRQLEQTAHPHTCPHGRPTMILLTAGQLERGFGRR